jgi:hypothetical protein
MIKKIFTRCGSHWLQSSHPCSHQQQHRSSHMLGQAHRQVQVHKQGQEHRLGQVCRQVQGHTGELQRQQPKEQTKQQSTRRVQIIL